jgi:hypothetical protein
VDGGAQCEDSGSAAVAAAAAAAASALTQRLGVMVVVDLDRFGRAQFSQEVVRLLGRVVRGCLPVRVRFGRDAMGDACLLVEGAVGVHVSAVLTDRGALEIKIQAA